MRIRESVDNSTFEYSLDLSESTEYDCSVSAVNEQGQGPESASVLFTTPAGKNDHTLRI